MAEQLNHTKMFEAVELIANKGFSGMTEAMQILFNEAMLIERSRYLGVGPYERSESRHDHANGFKNKQLKTTLGELSLQVPQVRSSEFYPSFLEKGIRSERALKLAMAEMYVQGVSTRNVEAILQELCGLQVSSSDVSRAAKLLDDELSKWKMRPLGRYVYLYVDARYEKVRQGGCVVDSAVLIAYGINADGKREILGLSVSLSEAEIHWRTFLESLVTRGLHGLECVISDAHSGLKAARTAVFPSVPWQRCQFHLQQNAQSYVTKQSRKREVADSIRAIFNAENKVEAERLLKLSVEKYANDMPKLAEWMEENIAEGLTIFHFASEHRRRLRTSNIAERVNEEIRRRTRVARIFPSVESCERLVGAIVMEISENWMADPVYLNVAKN
jgi:transposase-like protein